MAEQLRQSIRSQKLEERKEERLKVVNSKRLHLPPEEEYEVMSLEQFSGMVREAASRRQFSQLLRKIKWGLSQGEEYIAAFLVTPNVVDRLVASLLRNDTAIQLEAAACITNIACGNHKATSRVVRAAGPYLITFLNGGNPFLQDQCAWALGNMASDCGQCSERLRAMGLCYAMVKALETPHEQALGSCLFCLRAYVDSSSADIQSLVSLGLLEKLCSLWKREPTPETLLSHLARVTFSVYSRREDSTVTSKYSLEMCRLVTVHFLRHMQNKEPDITVLTPLVRCLATFAGFGWNSFSDAELGTSNVAACLGKLLKSPYLHLRRECLWLLNNLAAGSAWPRTDLGEVALSLDGVLSLIALGSPHIDTVLLLLKSITSILPSFREALAKNGSILTQLQVLANSSDRGAGVARELLTTLAAT